MGEVCTMKELERARKKAQVREWFQDKKMKVQICTAMTAVWAIIGSYVGN
nr:MAG TPA: hypothetical protein [Caudoviricetes sp.]